MDQLESLEAWKVARRVAVDAYRLTQRAPLAGHFALIDQVRRAALSVPANLVEGYALGTRPQFVRCTRIAFASAAELRLHLEMAQELGLIAAEDSTVLAECRKLVGLLVGLLKRLGARVPTRASPAGG